MCTCNFIIIMVVFNHMKRLLTVLSVLVVVFATAGVVWCNSMKTEDIKQPEAKTFTAEVVDEKLEVVDTFIPTPVNKEVEPVIDQALEAVEPEAPVNETTAIAPMTENEVFLYTIEYLKSRSIEISERLSVPSYLVVSNTINKNYNGHKSMFTRDTINSTIDSCVDYLYSFDKLDYAGLSRAYAQGDCGF